MRHCAAAGQRRAPADGGGHRGRGRGGQPDHPGDAGRDRRHPADGLRRRADGSLHAADPDRRLGRHGLLADRGVPGDPLGGGPHPARRRPRTATANGKTALTRLYRRVMGPLLHRPALRWGFLAMVALLLLGSCALVYVRVRQGEDAALRQQERVPGHHRHAGGHDAGGDGARHPGSGRRGAAAARGHQPPDLRGHGVALQLQRPGAPLLPAARLERGRHPGEPAAEGRARPAEPRDRQARPRAVAPIARPLRRPHQGGRGAARPAGASDAGGRDLRPDAGGPDRPGAADPRDLREDRRHGGCRLVRGGRPAEVPPRRRQGEGRAARHLRRRHRPDHADRFGGRGGRLAARRLGEGGRAHPAAAGPRRPLRPGAAAEPEGAGADGADRGPAANWCGPSR